MIIQLTEAEIVQGATVGAQRNVKKMVDGYRPILPNNCPDNQVWDNISEGACAEIALAKYFGIPYDPGYAGAMDVGEFDVRQSSHKEGHLLIQRWDKDRLTVAIFGKFGTYRIAGCFYNPVALQPKYWGNPLFEKRPCHAVPEKDLIPFTTMTDLEKIKATEIEKHRHQCDVRQLLNYYFENRCKYEEVIAKRGKNNQTFLDFVDQGTKGNKGDTNEWFD